jgi:hypothetical protein
LKIKDKSARLRAGLLPRLATTFKSTADWITRPYEVQATADMRADLPDGLFGNAPVQSCLQKYFHSRLTQIKSISLAVPSPRGAHRDRHGRGMGCGGRGSVGRVT